MELTLDQALQKGIEAHKAGKAEEADRYYTAILKANPKHPDANHNMGVLAVGVGKFDAALPFFKTAIEANSSIAQFWLSYIDALIKLNKINDAVAAVNEAKKQGVSRDGLTILEEKLNREPSGTNEIIQDPSKEVLQPLLNLYDAGKLQKATELLRKLLNSYPNSAILYNINGAVFEQLGNLNGSLDAYDKALAINPDYADAYNNKGNSLTELGKLDEAIEAYQKAIIINPDYAHAYYNMGNTLKEQGKLKEAIAAHSKAISIKSDYANSLNSLGNIYQMQGKLDKAREILNQTLEIKPDFAEAHNNIGTVLQNQGKFDKALNAYKEAIKFKPDLLDAYNNMAFLLQKQGKLEECLAFYNEALRIFPNNETLKMNKSKLQSMLVPPWHITMMNDQQRNKAYYDAIKLAVSPGDTVLEIGTGSGLLSMMAAASGASHIITCEQSKSIAEVSKKIIAANGFDSVITVLNKKSTDLIVDEDIPEKSDIVISEILSSEFVGEGVQATILDANNRLIKKNGRMLPESGDIRIALLGESVEVCNSVSASTASRFDISQFNLITGQKFHLNLREQPNFLSEPKIAFEINLSELKSIKTREKTIEFEVTKSGRCLGIIQWLGLQIFEEIKYENKPGETISHWSTPLYCFEKPTDLKVGEKIQVKATLFKDSLWFSKIF
jgi:tetratricopeptide (TPR) repeat protein/precorrin-6B methylase 2